MQRLFNRRSFGLGLAIAASAAVPAGAQAATVDTSMCSAREFSQPFLALKDSNWYTLAPGMSIDNVDGTGWELSGGAKLTTTTLADGKTGSVINLPSGAKAVSPVMCVTSEYPKARAYIRNLKGTEGVGFFVSYEGTKTWEVAKNTGQLHGELHAVDRLRSRQPPAQQQPRMAADAGYSDRERQDERLPDLRPLSRSTHVALTQQPIIVSSGGA